MIALIGINYKTAPVAIREKLSFTPDETTCFMERLNSFELINGSVLISTCNRTEIYVDATYDAPELFAIFGKVLREQKGTDFTANYFYQYPEQQTIAHLFQLAAGLESMVMGETQILGQLKDAYRCSTEHNYCTTLLSRLFHRAFETAKKVRSLHPVNAVPRSAGAAAVSFITARERSKTVHEPFKTANEPKKTAREPFETANEPFLTTHIPLVIGAGQMAETVVDALQASGYKQISVYNRTRERAEKFAGKHGLTLFVEDQLPKAIKQSTLVFVATSALTPIVVPEMIGKRDTPLTMFDLAVPRNVDEATGNLPGVILYTIDELRNTDETDTLFDEIPLQEAQDCIRDMVAEFEQWKASLPLKDVIQRIQSTFDTMLDKRLEWLEHKVSEEEYSLVEKNCRYMKDKYAYGIIAALRGITEKDKNIKYAEVVNRLLNYKDELK